MTRRASQSSPILNRAGKPDAAGPARDFWRIQSYATVTGVATAEIDIYGVIGEDWDPDTGERVGMSAQRFLAEVQALPTLSELTLRVCSPGGNSLDAAAIYSILGTIPCRKVGIVDGMAASAATVILMACDEVRMPSNALFMIHDPMMPAFGNAADMAAAIDSLNRVKATIVAAYAAKNAKMSAEEISAAMTATTWFSAAEALEAGFVDTVIEPAKVVNVASLDPAALKGAPEALARALADEKAAADAAAAAQEETMSPEIAKALETLTASVASLTETVATLKAAPAPEAQAENSAAVEKTQAEKDAESLAACKVFAEKAGPAIVAVFNRYADSGAPVEAVRTAVFGAAATADAHAKPVPGAGEAIVKNQADPLGLTKAGVNAWYDTLNKHA